MDIAQLAYSVDSSGLERGTRALDDNAKAAERTSAAAETLESRYRAIGQRGMEYAESMRSANQSDRSLAEAAREAAAGIDTKMQVMARSGTQQERMAAASAKLQAAEERTAKAAAEAARAHAAQELNLKKLLGQIDPTIGKLNQLASMEGRLEKALDIGAIKPELFDQYQAKIDSARAATLKMGQASEIATKGIGGLNLQSIQTQQSVASLARSLATGQWGMATTSLTSLTSRAGAMGGAFTATGLAVGGAGAALGTFAVMAGKGYLESRKLEGVIVGLGAASGVTTGQALELRNAIGSATGSYKDATDAVNQLLLSGKATSETLSDMANAAVNMSRLTGQSIGSTVSEIQALSDGGADALVKLNERYGFLTLATYQNIEAIREEKGEAAALQATLIELDRTMQDRADNMVGSAGRIERAWAGITKQVGGALQAMKDWGREDIEHRLKASISQMQNMKMGAGLSDPETYGPYLQARKEVERLLAERLAMSRQASARAGQQSGDNAAIEAERKLAEERKRATEEIDRQMQSVYGLDTAVNRLEQSFGQMSEERQKAMVEDGRYAVLMEKAIQDDAKRAASGERSSRAKREQISQEIKDAQRLQQQYESAEASLARQIALYGQAGHSAKMAYDTASGALSKFSAAQKANLMEGAQWLDFLDEVAVVEGVWADAAAERTERTIAGWKGAKDELSVYAEQAGKNMQDAFADFLFDPFDKGMGGMLESFAKTLQKMAAQAAAARIFESLGSTGEANSGTWWGSMLSGLFGKREYGGSVVGGGMYQVGERNKPELLSTPSGQFLIPGDHGRVDPIRASAPAGRGGSSGPMQVVINNNGNNQVQAREERQRMPDGSELRRLIVDVIAEDTANGGRTWAATKGRGGLRDAV